MLDAAHVVDAEVLVLALDLLERARPIDELRLVDGGHETHDMGRRHRPHRGRDGGTEQDQGVDLTRLGQLHGQQPTQAVPDDDGRAMQRLVAGDDVLEVGAEVELLEGRRLRPEVTAQVEGMAFPAALREVLQVVLPEPRTGQLTVQVEERPAARAALG